MEKINFEWYRGDDETETLVFESEGEPVDFTGCSFDMDIVPEMGGSRRIHLSHDKTDGAMWQYAAYDLQMTDGTGRVKTLCCGRIRLLHDVTRQV